ncbi:MAG: acetylglutamate kinase [Acidobacteriaceae bacterium]|nr:acetylglutamate kinase [Acidobacteriaceae bacterium]MBV9499117.1 acetylglutamate kinase [Acidobacteriaceae bacterium]
MKFLFKVGGTLLDDLGSRRAIVRQLAVVARNHEVVVVHGGGKQVTRFLEERGISSRFVNGLRVSDENVIDAVTQVISGSVNKKLVSALIAEGVPAIGLSGVDGQLTEAAALNPELQFVGQPRKSKGSLLNLLITAGYLPVIACVAGDSSGAIYNVNADQMAVSVALGWSAKAIVFLTDVPGVRGKHGEVIPQLTETEASDLLRSGVAHGGMQAKLEAANSALQGGISEVIIAPGHDPKVWESLKAGLPLGTRILAGALRS